MKSITIILCCSILMLSACSDNDRTTAPLNEKASLPVGLKFNNTGLKMMTSFFDKKSGSMSVLYTKEDDRILVTWKQQSDENWFGANIPGRLLSIEIVKTSKTGQVADYKNYNDKGLLTNQDTAWQKQRVSYILDQQPSVIP